MKVILLENIRKIGSIGDIIDVKRGFARNYLISSKKALYASKENIQEVEKIKQDLNKKDQEKKKDAKEIYEKINNKEYLLECVCRPGDLLFIPDEWEHMTLNIGNISVYISAFL